MSDLDVQTGSNFYDRDPSKMFQALSTSCQPAQTIPSPKLAAFAEASPGAPVTKVRLQVEPRWVADLGFFRLWVGLLGSQGLYVMVSGRMFPLIRTVLIHRDYRGGGGTIIPIKELLV